MLSSQIKYTQSFAFWLDINEIDVYVYVNKKFCSIPYKWDGSISYKWEGVLCVRLLNSESDGESLCKHVNKIMFYSV